MEIEKRKPEKSSAETETAETGHNTEDFGDLLEELRILLQGTQLLTSFLILLPFSSGFQKLGQFEKWLYLVIFVCSVISLICFSTPAAAHRLERPLRDRISFKIFATRMVIAGMVTNSLSIMLAVFLVVNEVIGFQTGIIVGGAVTILILIAWWFYPLYRKNKFAHKNLNEK